MGELKQAKNYGEVVFKLQFRTGSVGDIDPVALLPAMQEQLIAGLRESDGRIRCWGVAVEEASYEGYKDGKKVVHRPARLEWLRLDVDTNVDTGVGTKRKRKRRRK